MDNIESAKEMLKQSIEKARELGVPEQDIIHNIEELDSFMGW